MAILGLMDTQDLESNSTWGLTARREIFHRYPNGHAPLMGLLSLVGDEDKPTDKPRWGWEEHRSETFEYKTAQANSAGPFTATDGSSGAVGTDKTAAGFSQSAGDTIRVQLDSVSTIQVRDVLSFRNIPGTASSEKTFQGIVTAVWSAHDTVDVYLTAAIANVLNTTAANDLDVFMVGSTAPEADRSNSGFFTLPLEIENYTQIFRHAFEFSRNALKQGLKWDSDGIYKEKAKQNSLKHMIAMEKAAMFSERSIQTAVTTADGDSTQRRTMGGLLWFLKQWDLGNTGNGGAFNYRPNGSDLSAVAWDANDDKRVLDINGTVTKDEFEDIIERAFRYTNDSTFEKLFLCGSGLLKSFNKLVDRESLKTTKLSTKEAYGMDVTTWESPFGTLHFKTHPLLTQTAIYRNSGFILDLGELRYTPYQDSDTELLKNRQSNDFDGRKDEWLTEFGLEVRFPENHMFIDRLTGINS